MVSAVGLRSSAPASAGKPVRTPGLDAQLNTVRAQLADWVTCPSAKTPEGKAKIKEVTARFDAIKAQIVMETKTAEAMQAASSARTGDGGTDTTGDGAGTGADANARPSSTGSALGNNIDVYA